MMDIEKRLERIERLLVLGTKEVLNTADVALLLDVSESRIRHLTSAREIPYYKQGGRTYFKKKEIEEWQLSQRIPTNQEIKRRATTYNIFNK
ncbi:MAG: helix-turn-helix domain-containing protein [Candidatus Limimorpha sp.]